MTRRRRPLAALLVLAATLAAAPAARADDKGGSDEELKAALERRTQELLDAVTNGRKEVWERYLDPDMTYTDETGAVQTKRSLVDQVAPLPKNISGELKVSDFSMHRHGDTVITLYVSVETETYFGQVLHARYRETDTWRKTADGWRIIGAQLIALRDDPPTIALPAARLDEYVGVYRLTPEVTYTIRRDGDQLLARRTGREETKLLAEAGDVFFVPGQPRLRTIFRRGPDGKITGFVERRETWDVLWTREPSPR